MYLFLDMSLEVAHLRLVHSERGSDHDSDLNRGMWHLAVWGVTFLQLPRASGESFFTPLFDIVKTTTTEGIFPFYRRQGFEKLQTARDE